MNTLEQSILDGTRDIALTSDERDTMRASLSAYMAYHPIRDQEQRPSSVSVPNPFAYFRHRHLIGGALVAVLLTTSSYGVSSAAESALPGDFLYVVKVDVNEELKTVFLSSDEERIVWEQERAARRLSEASELAAVGRLDSKAKEEVSRRFAAHAQSVVEQTQAVEESDPVLAAEVASDFETSLDTHEAVLARLAVAAPEEEAVQARGLVEQVRGTAMEASKVRTEVEDRITRSLENTTAVASATLGEGSTSATAPQEEDAIRDRALTRANERAERARENAKETLTELASELITAQAHEQLALAEDIETQARERQQEGDTLGAYRLFKEAAARYQKVTHSIKVAQVLDSTMLPGGSVASAPAQEVASSAAMSDATPEQDEPSVEARGAELEERLNAVRATTNNREALTLLGEARASVLRGEVAQNLGDTESATRFFDEALQFVVRAEELGGASEESDKADLDEPTSPTEASSSPELPGEVAVPDMPELDVVTVYHEFASGTHRYAGYFYTPTPCFSLNAEALVAESLPEQVTIELTTTEGAEVCAMVLDRKTFVVEVVASPEATLVGVSVNGHTSKWKSVEGELPEDDSDTTLPVQPVPPATPEREQQKIGTSSLLERAFEATASLLRPQ